MGGNMLHVDGNCCGSKKVEVNDNHPQVPLGLLLS